MAEDYEMPDGLSTDAGYLESAARIIFMGGLNRSVVDSKWRGFREAFHGFDVARVAEMGPEDVERLSSDDRVIKYHAKLAAIVHNAQEMQAIAAENGSFGAFVEQALAASGLDATCRTLSDRFGYISRDGARNWLYATGHDVGEVTDKVRAKYAPFDG
jgi:3-methyladenine DNA glycosylase Tag